MIRKAKLTDVSRIAEINVYGWRNTYLGIISNDILFKELSVEKSIARYSKAIQEEDNSIYVFEDDESEIIKAMMGIFDCFDEQIKNAFELKYIYVETAFCREGIGTKLLNYFEEVGKAKGKSAFVIYTIDTNYNARNFYEKNGYKSDGVKKYNEKLNITDVRYVKNVF